MSWRDRARPIIAKALHEAAEQGMVVAEAKKYIHSKYPFGPREMYPYKVWCDEVKRQLNAAKKSVATYVEPQPKPIKPLEGQQELFA